MWIDILAGIEHTEVLGHGVGLEGEGVELVGVDGELLLDGSERLVVDEEEDLENYISICFVSPQVAGIGLDIQFRRQRGKPRA